MTQLINDILGEWAEFIGGYVFMFLLGVAFVFFMQKIILKETE